MRTIRKTALGLVVLAALVFSTDMIARTAYCANCDKGGAVDFQCTGEELQDVNDCCQAFGCNSSWSVSYCINRSEGVYNGCVILAGCPNLAN